MVRNLTALLGCQTGFLGVSGLGALTGGSDIHSRSHFLFGWEFFVSMGMEQKEPRESWVAEGSKRSEEP
jgi:hypothetical protein